MRTAYAAYPSVSQSYYSYSERRKSMVTFPGAHNSMPMPMPMPMPIPIPLPGTQKSSTATQGYPATMASNYTLHASSPVSVSMPVAHPQPTSHHWNTQQPLPPHSHQTKSKRSQHLSYPQTTAAAKQYSQQQPTINTKNIDHWRSSLPAAPPRSAEYGYSSSPSPEYQDSAKKSGFYSPHPTQYPAYHQPQQQGYQKSSRRSSMPPTTLTASTPFPNPSATNYTMPQQQQQQQKQQRPSKQPTAARHSQLLTTMASAAIAVSNSMGASSPKSMPMPATHLHLNRKSSGRRVTFSNPIAQVRELTDICSTSAPAAPLALAPGAKKLKGILKKPSPITTYDYATPSSLESSTIQGYSSYEPRQSDSGPLDTCNDPYCRLPQCGGSGNKNFVRESFYGNLDSQMPSGSRDYERGSFYDILAELAGAYKYDGRFAESMEHLPLKDNYRYY
ncbi:hypothetical protein GGI07_000769 [Coemansia sp. Benny D115]|nr:hypothetical protein GGI07_000769 [Coemansia sp. Benny D115]